MKGVFWDGAAASEPARALAFVPHTAATLAACLLKGLAGAALLLTVQAALADRHGALRAVALTEANVAATLMVTLTPLLIGAPSVSGSAFAVDPGERSPAAADRCIRRAVARPFAAAQARRARRRRAQCSER